MKKCKYCKTEIDDKAKICPHCRKKQSGGCGTVLLVLLFIFLAFILLCIIGGYHKASEDKKITNEAKQYTESEYKAACKAVSFEEIARDKEALKGEKVTFEGEVIQASSGLYRMNVTKTTYGYTDTIIIDIDENSLSEKILEDDIITIWGESTGQYTYKSVLGAEITVPRIRVIYVEDHGKAEK